MDNLWERLKPELKAVLIEKYKDLPNMLNELKEILENEKYYTHVPYWVYSDLRFFTKYAFGELDIFFNNYFLPQ